MSEAAAAPQAALPAPPAMRHVTALEVLCYLAGVAAWVAMALVDAFGAGVAPLIKIGVVILSVVLVLAGMLSHPIRRTLARRELAALFFSPIAYVTIAVFLLLTGFLFMAGVLVPQAPAEMRWLFNIIVWILIPLAPAVSMRLLAEELRSGTIEPLMTSPVTDVQVVMGKWLGGLLFFVALLAPTAVFVVLMEVWADPDYGMILAGYVGLLFVGGLYLAIGALASVLTRNQIIAFMLTIFLVLLVTVLPWVVSRYLPDWLANAVRYLDVQAQYDDFAKGLIDLSNIVYFVSGILLFLVLAVKMLETRRWR